jgi:hypothetical protein
LNKTSNNIESAKKMIHDMRAEDVRKNKDFVNLHQTNRKRKFNEINSMKVDRDLNEDSNKNNNNINGSGSINTNIETTSRKILNVKINNPTPTPILNDDELEKMLVEVGQMKSREEIKEYMRNKISNFMSIKLFLIFRK